MTDFELFDQIKQRNRTAFDKLFRKYYTYLCRFSFTINNLQEDAEECVQDMFVHLWEKAPELELHTSVKAYLYTSTRNYTLNAIKASAQRCSIGNEDIEKLHADFYAESTPADQLEQEGRIARLIQSGIQQLPLKCREIFILSKQEGLTYEEIAAYLNISEKTVENQMRIALRKLKEDLYPAFKEMLFYVFLCLSAWGKCF